MNRKTTVFVALASFSYILQAAEQTGTGFAFATNKVLTAYHVIDSSYEISVRFGSEEQTATIEQYDKRADWAILTLSKPVSSVAIIDCSDSSDIGDHVYTLGYPSPDILGEEIKYNDGTISSKRGLEGRAAFYQISIPIQPGNSGGPLFNKDGHAIGIIVSTINPEFFITVTGGALPQNINFALRLSTINSLKEIRAPAENMISVSDNQKAVCFIRAKIASESRTQSHRTPPKADAPPNSVSMQQQAQAKYELLMAKLETFSPSNCCNATEESRPILTDADYDTAKAFLDSTYADLKSCIDTGWHSAELQKFKKVAARKSWCTKRDALASYYNKMLYTNGITKLTSVFGLDLYGARTQFLGTNLEKFTKVPAEYSNAEWVEGSIAYLFPMRRSFFQQPYLVIFKTEREMIPIGIYLTAKLKKYDTAIDADTAAASQIAEIVSLFEKKFSIRFSILQSRYIGVVTGSKSSKAYVKALNAINELQQDKTNSQVIEDPYVRKGLEMSYYYQGELLNIKIIGSSIDVKILIERPNWRSLAQKEHAKTTQEAITEAQKEIHSTVEANYDAL